jgi:DNA-binding GntR family transcriptional regulator
MMERTKVVYENPTNAYERDFGDSLLEFIKTDDLLRDSYDHFILECEIIIKLIENLDNATEDAGVSIRPLEKIIGGFLKVKAPKKLALLDSKFHEQLFQIVDNKVHLETWQQEKSLGFSDKIWQSVCRDTAHQDKLCKIHFEILTAIKNKDRGKAISAMQEHFTVMLIHLYSAN